MVSLRMHTDAIVPTHKYSASPRREEASVWGPSPLGDEQRRKRRERLISGNASSICLTRDCTKTFLSQMVLCAPRLRRLDEASAPLVQAEDLSRCLPDFCVNEPSDPQKSGPSADVKGGEHPEKEKKKVLLSAASAVYTGWKARSHFRPIIPTIPTFPDHPDHPASHTASGVLGCVPEPCRRPLRLTNDFDD
eukprot:scaffold178_cov255-Pinguiococcus_pyrenoidosus.AAC.9